MEEMKKNNEDITLNDLATMVKGGFDAVDKRFGKIEGRFDILERDHEEIKLRLDNVPYRFELQEVVKRLEALESKR